MQSVPKKVDVQSIEDKIRAETHVIDLHDLHIWELSSGKYICTIHFTCLEGAPFMLISSRIKRILHKQGIHSSTIQPEYVHEDDLRVMRERCGLKCDEDCEQDGCCSNNLDEALPNEVIAQHSDALLLDM